MRLIGSEQLIDVFEWVELPALVGMAWKGGRGYWHVVGLVWLSGRGCHVVGMTGIGSHVISAGCKSPCTLQSTPPPPIPGGGIREGGPSGHGDPTTPTERIQPPSTCSNPKHLPLNLPLLHYRIRQSFGVQVGVSGPVSHQRAAPSSQGQG